MKTRFSKFQYFLVAILTIFYFCYMLVPNQDPTGQVRGVYYGSYVWPVGVALFRIFGTAGWALFGSGMIVWFWYSLPLYIFLHNILQIQIPFTANPTITGEYPLPLWGWIVMFIVVVLYNFLIALGVPYIKSLIFFFFKSANVMSFDEPIHKGMPSDMKVRGFKEN